MDEHVYYNKRFTYKNRQHFGQGALVCWLLAQTWNWHSLLFHLLIEGNAVLLSKGFAYRERNNCILFLTKKSITISINQKEVKKRGGKYHRKSKNRTVFSNIDKFKHHIIHKFTINMRGIISHFKAITSKLLELWREILKFINTAGDFSSFVSVTH